MKTLTAAGILGLAVLLAPTASADITGDPGEWIQNICKNSETPDENSEFAAITPGAVEHGICTSRVGPTGDPFLGAPANAIHFAFYTTDDAMWGDVQNMKSSPSARGAWYDNVKTELASRTVYMLMVSDGPSALNMLQEYGFNGNSLRG